MTEVCTQEQATSAEQRPTDELTQYAVAILDAYKVEAVPSHGGTITRTVIGLCNTVLTETEADGKKAYKVTHPVFVASLGEDGEKTAEWEEGSRSVDLLFDMQDTGPHYGTAYDAAKIAEERRWLSTAFSPLPEKQPPVEPPVSKFKALLARAGCLLLGRS